MFKAPGSKNPNWKGGKPKCIDCEKELGYQGHPRPNRRCRPCYVKFTSVPENNPAWKGGSFCIDCKKKIWYGQKRCGPCYHKTHSGKNSPLYKEKLSYSYIHDLMSKIHGKPRKCDHCGTQGKYNKTRWSIHWANKTGKYLRDRSDWLWLCVRCHRIYDRNPIMGSKMS